jgi:hypothetical protein
MIITSGCNSTTLDRRLAKHDTRSLCDLEAALIIPQQQQKNEQVHTLWREA